MRRGPHRTLGMLLLLVLLSGCSGTTFIYNRLDFLLPWYLGDYMELSRPQKKQLDNLLEPFLWWHRMEELPRYVDVIDQMEATLDAPLELEHVVGISKEFEQAWKRLEKEGLDWMLTLGESLTDDQVAAFLEHMVEQQEEYEEKYLPRTEVEYREETYESMLDSFQDFLGKLDKTQKGRLQEAAESMIRSDAAWLEERAIWIGKLEGLLQREPGWQGAVRQALEDRDRTSSPEYEEVYAHNTLQIQLAVVDVVNSRSDKQDRKARKKLKNFREDLNTLIEQGREKQGKIL